jgi:hypothetical protein
MLEVAISGLPLNTVLNSVGTEANGNISIPVFESPMSISLDSVTTNAEASVIVNGLAISATLGNESIVIDVDTPVTGQVATTSLANVGVTGNAEVQLNGLPLTVQLNSVFTLEWEIVDVGTSVVYTEVNTGTSAVFTDVDTGTNVVWIDIAA